MLTLWYRDTGRHGRSVVLLLAAVAAVLTMAAIAGPAWAARSGGVLGENLSMATAASTPGASSNGAAWGSNEEGQLGDGTNTGPANCSHEFKSPCSTTPVSVSGLSNVTAVAAGAYHAVALTQAGSVMTWGDNDAGQLGNGTEVNSDVPVSVNGIAEASAISAGALYSLALLKSGTVKAWGTNYAGQLGNGSTTPSDTPVTVAGLSGVIAIAAGGKHALALLNNGTVMAWGENRYGQLGNGTTTNRDVPVQVSGLSGVTAIAGGADYSLAVLGNGTVMAWGANSGGQLGDGTNTGPETCEGEGGGKDACSRTPVAVSGLGETTAVAAGGCEGCGDAPAQSLALLKDGRLMAWAANGSGQLGDGTTTGPETCEGEGAYKFPCARTPVAVNGITEATSIAAGWGHDLALLKGGTVMTWGSNGGGDLGDGNTTPSDVPVTAAGLIEAGAISGGDSFSLASGVLVTLPTVTAVEPSDGPAGGGTSVTISGTSFTGTSTVKFGTSNATSFKVNSETSITAIAPAGVGLVDVTVTTATGTSIASRADQYDYAPTVTGLAPAGGPAAGGTSTTISGTNFNGVTAVKFGTTNAASITVNSPTSITAVSPAGTGRQAVTVTTAGGTSPTTPADEFGYGPTISQMLPRSGPLSGGTSVTIIGTNFTGATAVKFGSRNAASFTVNSAESITAVSPAGEEFRTEDEVAVTTPEGTTPPASVAEFRYVSGCELGHAPTVVSVEPSTAPAGTAVTIKGANFFIVVCGDEGFSARRVMFGAEEASFTSERAGELLAVAPPGSGTVDVTVESMLGASPVTPSDRFRYGSAGVPSVSKVEPARGAQAGGTSVTITGMHLAGASAVHFGARSAESFHVNSESSITAVAPRWGNGNAVAEVTVTTPGGTSQDSIGDSFIYESTVSRIEPASGPAAGGNTVTISGAAFEGQFSNGAGEMPPFVEAVRFGSTSATSFTVDSEGTITAVAPAGTGTVDVTVETLGGKSAASIADQYSYPLGPPCTPEGFCSSFGPAGETLEGRFAEPEAVAVDPSGNIWIADSGHDRVLELNSKHGYLRQFGSEGAGEGQFKGIKGIATNKEGDVYVSDYGNDRVQEFSPSGAFIRKFGSLGTGKGQLIGPAGIAIDSSGDVWVLNAYGGRAQEFSSSGEYLSGFDSAVGFSADPGLAISGGNLYVSEELKGRVQEFSTAGTSLATFDERGSGSGKSSLPWAIATDPNTGNLYVSDVGNDNVQEFSSSGSFIASSASAGYGAGQLLGPKGIAVSSTGHIYVADAGNNRVGEWGPTP